MGKILPKKKFFKSAIYTPHLPVGSHIDNVKYSLEHLIFSNTREVENTLLKKRIKVIALTTVFLMIIGSFLSPKGQAEVATFYPTACLGGWNNPRNAEGEPQVGVSGDASEFNIENSAMLAKETSADIYCGSFVGKIEQNTKPIKMVVSLSWSAKDILVHGKQIEIASSTENVDLGTTTASTTVLLASSTETIASPTSSSTEVAEVSASTTLATTTEDTSSTLDKVVNLVQDVFGKVFGNDTASTTQASSTVEVKTSESAPATTTEVTPVKTDTEEAPTKVEEKAPEAAPVESAPTSFLDSLVQKIAGRLITKVFAEEITKVLDATSTHEENGTITSTSTSTSTENISTATSSDVASSTNTLTSTTTVTENTNNDFLEVLYTFDGVIWNSLGTVNESSIQYRTFEIPVTASTSWEDMGQLQIKVKPVQRIDEKPIVYLDGIKVEVLYETPLTHEHPDFLRDTILQDDIVKGVRILRIINNDTNKEEIWYMRPEATSTDIGTTTAVIATSSESITASTTENNQNNTLEISSSTNATSTPNTATSTPTDGDRVIKPSSIKNKWLKLDSTEVAAKGVEALLKEIDAQEKRQEYMYPDFTKDLIKQIQGGFLNRVFVQVEQMGTSTLWLFDTANDTQEKIDIDGKTTFSKTYPFGVKGDNVFWLSEDELTLFVFNVTTKEIQHKEIPEYDKSLGQRGEVTFETIPWKIIIGAQDFSFYSEETGEVFSDDDLTASEAFRVKEKLDSMLPKEKLEELELIVDETKH